MADPLCNAGNGLLFLVSCYGSLCQAFGKRMVLIRNTHG